MVDKSHMCTLSQPCVDDLSYPDGYTDQQSLRWTFGLCEAWQEEQTSEMLPAMQQQAKFVEEGVYAESERWHL